MARTSQSSSPPPARRGTSRSGSSGAANAIRPSAAFVSFLDRTVSRLTSSEPWTYRDARSAPGDGEAPSRGASGSTARDLGRTRPRRPARDTETVPEAVRARFVRVGRDYYFEDGTRAFRDHGHKIVSHTENTQAIRGLIAIAAARDWNDVTVTGSRRFRHEAWYQATLAGLIVRGYAPTEFERAKLVRDLARSRAPVPRTPVIDDPAEPFAQQVPAARARTARAPSNPAADAAQGRAESAQGAAAATVDRASSSPASGPNGRERASSASPRRSSAGAHHRERQRARELAGTLLRHGAAPYAWHPQGDPSYFVAVNTRGGERILWGVDLERALRESKSAPAIGDEVVIRQVGRERVQVRRRAVSPEGEVLGEQPIEADRNRWAIEKRSFLDERTVLAKFLRDPSADPPDEVRQIPALAGSYLTLKTASVFAKERIADAASRAAFLAAVREQLARAVEAGESISAPRLRERPAPRAGRVSEREASRTLS